MNDPGEWYLLFLLGATFVLLLAAFFLALYFVRPWIRALMYGTPVTIVAIIGMRLRGNPPMLLVESYITLKRAGIAVTIADVENTYIDNKSRIYTSDDLVALVKKKAISE